jgi:hypothetical protein
MSRKQLAMTGRSTGNGMFVKPVGMTMDIDKAKRIVYYGDLLTSRYAGVAQLVEHKLPKLGVAGSSPVARSSKDWSAHRSSRRSFLRLGKGWIIRGGRRWCESGLCPLFFLLAAGRIEGAGR